MATRLAHIVCVARIWDDRFYSVSSSLWLATSFAVVHPSLDNVIVLGLIVLIRTFLSMSLQLELEGRWSWQNHDVPEAKPK